VTENRWWCFL